MLNILKQNACEQSNKETHEGTARSNSTSFRSQQTLNSLLAHKENAGTQHLNKQ